MAHQIEKLLHGATGVLVVGAVLAGAGGLAGCGSGASSSVSNPISTAGTGRATFTVRWPDRSDARLIPAAANSIAVHLTSIDGTQDLGETVLARPTTGNTTTASFNDIPPGVLKVSAAAYPTINASGVAQASAQTQATIQANQVTNVYLALASTIAQIAITPSTSTLNLNQTRALSITAKDAAGAVVLTGTSTLTWSSDTPSIASIDSSGNVTGTGAGSTTIRVTEKESGQKATLTVNVSDPNAALYIYEGFNYPVGTNLTGQNGGTGWSNPWRSHGPGTLSKIVSGLTYGKLAVSGNAFQSTSSNPIGDDRDSNQVFGVPGSTFYWSALVRPLAVTGGSPDSYFGYQVASNYYIGKGGAQTPLGIERSGGGEFVSAGINPQPNTTYFLVVRGSFGASTDSYDLWVNPTPGQSLPSTPNATKTIPHINELVTQQTFGSSVPCVYDEYRVGPTWDSVSPTTP